MFLSAVPREYYETRWIMKNETLRAFYYGHLVPWDERILRGSDGTRVAKELSDAESQLAHSLPADLRPALDRLTKAQENLDGTIAETSYIDGFRTGARIMMEILADTEENLKPIAK